MGAGRCGTSSLISFLNSDPDFFIYGENHGAILNLLQAVHNIQIAKQYIGAPVKSSQTDYASQPYIGTEWFNDRHKLDSLGQGLMNCVELFFSKAKLLLLVSRK